MSTALFSVYEIAELLGVTHSQARRMLADVPVTAQSWKMHLYSPADFPPTLQARMRARVNEMMGF